MYFTLTKYCSSNQIKKVGWTVHVAHMGENKNTYKILVGNMNDSDRLKDCV